jgi:hypothetical protein
MDEYEGVLRFWVYAYIVYHEGMMLDRGQQSTSSQERLSRISMVVASSVARFTAGHLAVSCFPVKGNWETTDPLRSARTRIQVYSNMV